MSLETYFLLDEDDPDLYDMDENEVMELAENGDVRAMLFLAEYYECDDECDDECDALEDLEKAAYWYEKAAQHGHPMAMYNIGLRYSKGAGVSRDYAKAVSWMREAADHGDEDAEELVILYESAAKLKIMAETGDSQAQGDYAWVLMEIAKSMGQTYFDEDTFYESIEWAKKAEPYDIDSAMWVLATTYYGGRGDIERNDEKALMYYEKGAALGHAGCLSNVACCYMAGDIYPQDKEKGFRLMKEAAEGGYPVAMQNLIKAYRSGDGTEENKDMADYWEEAALDAPSYIMYVLSCLKSLKSDSAIHRLETDSSDLEEPYKTVKRDDGNLKVLSYAGEDLIVEVPAYIGTDKVVEIGEYAFSPSAKRCTNRKGRKAIEQIIFPDTVHTVHWFAFRDCSGLRSLVFKGNLEGDLSVYIDREGSFDTIVFCDGVEKLQRIDVIVGGENPDTWNTIKLVIPGSVTSIEGTISSPLNDFEIITLPGSYAEEYAKQNGIPVVYKDTGNTDRS